MTAAQLRLLRVLRLELITDRVKQLDIALLWVLLECGNESPGHRACGLAGDLCVLPVEEVNVSRSVHSLGPACGSVAVVLTQPVVPTPQPSHVGLLEARGRRSCIKHYRDTACAKRCHKSVTPPTPCSTIVQMIKPVIKATHSQACRDGVQTRSPHAACSRPVVVSDIVQNSQTPWAHQKKRNQHTRFGSPLIHST